MYLTENTAEAKEMRQNVKQMLLNTYKQSILSALAFINDGGFHKDFLIFEKEYVLRIVNVYMKGFLEASLKQDNVFKTKSYYFSRYVNLNMNKNIFKFIYGKVVVSCYESNPCYFKYYAYFFIACENISCMKICTNLKTHKPIFEITRFILKDSNVDITENSFYKEISISRI